MVPTVSHREETRNTFSVYANVLCISKLEADEPDDSVAARSFENLKQITAAEVPFASLADAKSILARDASAFQVSSSELEPNFEDQ